MKKGNRICDISNLGNGPVQRDLIHGLVREVTG